ncbi:MAG: hypothetical protein DHS20C16_35200 [Phycisphaerae bacterium]|nr:MAG: hypothetical protein DHS20C16_35200 [Phycisphaerae bacterium]
MIYIKRVYEPPENTDGVRLLVERLWPRGVKKDDLKLDGWIKDAAPSTELRKWFSHDPSKWNVFQQRYRAELDENLDAWHSIVETAKKTDVTLLFSSRDTEHNNVVVLKKYLEERLSIGGIE